LEEGSNFHSVGLPVKGETKLMNNFNISIANYETVFLMA